MLESNYFPLSPTFWGEGRGEGAAYLETSFSDATATMPAQFPTASGIFPRAWCSPYAPVVDATSLQSLARLCAIVRSAYTDAPHHRDGASSESRISLHYAKARYIP